MSGRFIEKPAILRKLARSQGWDCVLDATSNQGRGPLRQRFPNQWHLIERNGVRRPELHPGTTISEAFRGGWVSSLFVSKRWQSPKRNRLCAQHVVAVMGHLPVLEVSEGSLRDLEDSLHWRPTRYGRGMSNSLVRRAVTLTRRAVFQFQLFLGTQPLVAAQAAGPRKRQGVVWERRPGSVREFSAVWEQLPNDRVRAVVALICAGATEAEVQRMQCTDLAPEGFVWLPVVGPDRSLGRWIVLPRWARPAVTTWRLRRPRVQSLLLFPGRDDPTRPMSTVTPTLKTASQRAGVTPFTVARLRQVFQAVGRKFKLARGLVRHSVVHAKAETGEFFTLPAGYQRLATRMGNWARLEGVPPSIWEGARVPRRAPKGTGEWEPEEAFRGFVRARRPARPMSRKLRRPKKRKRKAVLALPRAVAATRKPTRSVPPVARKKHRPAPVEPARNPYPPVQLCGPEPPLPPVHPSVQHLVAKPAKPNRNYAKPAPPWPWNQKK